MSAVSIPQFCRGSGNYYVGLTPHKESRYHRRKAERRIQRQVQVITQSELGNPARPGCCQRFSRTIVLILSFMLLARTLNSGVSAPSLSSEPSSLPHNDLAPRGDRDSITPDIPLYVPDPKPSEIVDLSSIIGFCTPQNIPGLILIEGRNGRAGLPSFFRMAHPFAWFAPHVKPIWPEEQISCEPFYEAEGDVGFMVAYDKEGGGPRAISMTTAGQDCSVENIDEASIRYECLVKSAKRGLLGCTVHDESNEDIPERRASTRRCMPLYGPKGLFKKTQYIRSVVDPDVQVFLYCNLTDTRDGCGVPYVKFGNQPAAPVEIREGDLL